MIPVCISCPTAFLASCRLVDAIAGPVPALASLRSLDHEWQVMDAFIGYLDRHLAKHIESISVYYR
jgi:hypothetical protein